MSPQMVKYICYNWFGIIADHCLDFSAQKYKRMGVTKLHSKNLIPESVKPNDVVFVGHIVNILHIFYALLHCHVRYVAHSCGTHAEVHRLNF